MELSSGLNSGASRQWPKPSGEDSSTHAVSGLEYSVVDSNGIGAVELPREVRQFTLVGEAFKIV